MGGASGRGYWDRLVGDASGKAQVGGAIDRA